MRGARRSWRLAAALLPAGGGLLPLMVALLLAVAVVAAIGWLNSRLMQTLVAEGSSWLAGDLQIAASRPFGAAWQQWRTEHPEVAVVESVTTVTLVRAEGEEGQLVALRAIGPGYPLRGTIHLFAGDPRDPNQMGGSETVPAPPLPEGSAWVDARLASLLGVAPGSRLAVGRTKVTVAAILARTPEQGADFLSFLPEVIVPLATLEASGLLGPGSRATWRWHLAVPAERLAAIKAAIKARLQLGERLVTLEEIQPAVQQLLVEVGRLLRLATIAAVLLAAVAVAFAARRLAVQMVPRVTVVRALGGKARTLGAVLALRLCGVVVAAVAGGLLLGWVAQAYFAALVAEALRWPALAPPVWEVVWPAPLLALLLVVAFVVPWWRWVMHLPPVWVLRQSAPPFPPLGWLGWGSFALGALAAVAVALAGEWWLSLTALLVMGGVALLFGSAAFGGLQAAAAGLGRRGPLALRLALRFLAGQPVAVVVQVTALAVGLTTLWLLLFVRSDLLAAWRYQTPLDAPTHFLLNVMSDQVDALRDQMTAAGVPAPRFWPVVRGRLTAINGAPIPAEILADPRAERLAHREFNLTWASELPEENRIVAGRWHGTAGQGEASVEAGLAKRFRLQVGDRVTFSVAGEAVTVTITSIRALRWESMRPNFFFIMSPEALAGAPATFMAALRLPLEAATVERAWRRDFPNVTVLDVAALRGEFERLAEEVTYLLSGVFAFTLSLGGVVLSLGWAMGEARRSQQVALLRALGVERSAVAQVVVAEGLVVGLLAAGLSVGAALLLGQWLAYALFDLTLPVRWLPLAGAAAGVVGAVVLMGWLRTRSLLTQPPMGMLRRASG